MRRATAVLGSGVFFVIAPGVVAGLIPWWITRWQFMPPFLNMELTRVMGFLLMLAGVPGLVDSFRRFAVQGLGTPAPVAPPQHLVTTGLYRYVRNPMYFSVVAVILGQAGVFADWRLIAYGALVWLACHMFVIAYEEPALQVKFGEEYRLYRANVPRWIPRTTAWQMV